MKIHEYQAIELFKSAGIPIASGEAVSDFELAEQVAEKIGFPLVLKSQVLVGGRGKAGGVKIAKDKEEFQTYFSDIKNLNIKGYVADKIFLVRAVDFEKEFYASVTIDHAQGDIVLIASAQGGVDIEETAKMNPEHIHKFYLQRQKHIDELRWPAFIQEIFSDPNLQQQGTDIFKKLLKLFFQTDCSLAEINPLVLTKEGTLLAIDAKINFDDNALFRQPEIAGLRDMKFEDADEIAATEHGLSFVKMEGNVGCIVNGAGLAMATMDVIKLVGGEPANFLDVGGSSNPDKVLNALKMILKNHQVKSVLINIFGGITRCDDIAKGILAAREQLEIPVPLVVRLTGTNEQEAKQMLSAQGINTYPSMRAAVEQAVFLAR